MTSTTFERMLPDLPRRMLCTDSFAQGVFFRGRDEAILKRYIGPNTKNQVRFILVDIDREGGEYAALDAGIKLPTFVTVSPITGHCHAGWQLKKPVSLSSKSLKKPINYLMAIRHVLTQAVGADMAYNGRLTQNPLKLDYWQVLTSGKCANGESYYLSELLELDDGGVLDLSAVRKRLTRAPKLRLVSEGRNCSLFETLAKWSYRAVKEYWPNRFSEWREHANSHAQQLNQQFDVPLSMKEAATVAKSVAGWTWRNFSPETFSEIQRRRANKRWSKESKREDIKNLLIQGISDREIMTQLAVSRTTIYRVRSTLES